MNFGFSGEMIFLFFLALILFGPKKLPEIGRTIGRFMNEFRRASNEFRSQIESEINSLETQSKPQQILPPIREPLGSLASRIFNPPSAEKLQEAEARGETEAAEVRTAEVHPSADNGADAVAAPVAVPEPGANENTSDAERRLAASAPPIHSPAVPSKVAPDA
jgi:sec-independent protein translocase protein TatB